MAATPSDAPMRLFHRSHRSPVHRYRQLLQQVLLLLALCGFGPLMAQTHANQGLAVAVRDFVGSGSAEVRQFGPGFSDLLMVDLIDLTTKRCPFRVVEWKRSADALREIELQHSRYGDPATAVKRGQLVQPDVFIDGQLSSLGNGVRWDIQIRDALSGAVLDSERGQADDAQVFDAITPLAERLADKLCKLRVGFRIRGQIDDATVQGVACGLTRPFEASSPEVAGRWHFVPRSGAAGTFSYTAADVGGLTGSGSGSYAVVREGGLPVRLQLAGKGSIHSPLGTFSAEITESLDLEPIPSCERIGFK